MITIVASNARTYNTRLERSGTETRRMIFSCRDITNSDRVDWSTLERTTWPTLNWSLYIDNSEAIICTKGSESSCESVNDFREERDYCSSELFGGRNEVSVLIVSDTSLRHRRQSAKCCSTEAFSCSVSLFS